MILGNLFKMFLIKLQLVMELLIDFFFNMINWHLMIHSLSIIVSIKLTRHF